MKNKAKDLIYYYCGFIMNENINDYDNVCLESPN